MHQFSVRTQPKLGILTNLQDQELCATCSINLSPAESTNIKILFKCDISPCARTGISAVGDRALPIRYNINKSSKPILRLSPYRNFLFRTPPVMD